MSRDLTAINPVLRSRCQIWLGTSWLLIAAIVVTAVAVGVYRFLYGDASPVAAGASSTGLAVSPDGRTVYVADSADGIVPVSVATGKAGRAIAISGGAPGSFIGGPVGGMAITPDCRMLFTTVFNEKSDASLPLARVDLRTGEETAQVSVPGGAVFGFVLSRDGKTLYVVSGDSRLYAVNAATGRTERLIPAPRGALEDTAAMVLAPDGRTLYTAIPGDDSPDSGSVVAVNLETGAVGHAVSVRWEPTSLAVTSDGRTLYAAIDGMDAFGQSFPNRIVAIDTATGQVSASIPWKVPPQQLVAAPDGATVWVTSVTGDRVSTADDTVTRLSVATGQPGGSFRTGGLLNSAQRAPAGVMLSPDGRRIYVAVPAGLETFSVGERIPATGWDVGLFAVVWLLTLTVLVLDFTGVVRRGAAWRWQGSGLLLVFSAMLINTYAQYLGWSGSWFHPLFWPTVLVGVALVIGGSLAMRIGGPSRPAKP